VGRRVLPWLETIEAKILQNKGGLRSESLLSFKLIGREFVAPEFNTKLNPQLFPPEIPDN